MPLLKPLLQLLHLAPSASGAIRKSAQQFTDGQHDAPLSYPPPQPSLAVYPVPSRMEQTCRLCMRNQVILRRRQPLVEYWTKNGALPVLFCDTSKRSDQEGQIVLRTLTLKWEEKCLSLHPKHQEALLFTDLTVLDSCLNLILQVISNADDSMRRSQ